MKCVHTQTYTHRHRHTHTHTHTHTNTRIYIYIYIYILLVKWEKERNTLKWIGPLEDLFLSYSFFFNSYFMRFTSSSWSKVVCSCVPYDLYDGNCFDKVVVLLSSRICVCESSVWINSPWQIFFSAGVVSLFLSFLFSLIHFFLIWYFLECATEQFQVKIRLRTFLNMPRRNSR